MQGSKSTFKDQEKIYKAILKSKKPLTILFNFRNDLVNLEHSGLTKEERERLKKVIEEFENTPEE